MTELTIEEINFLRWLLDQNEEARNEQMVINRVLTDYQMRLLSSIQSKLRLLSSY